MLECWATQRQLSHAPAQALELIEREDFDLIISDFRMPGLNGEQFYELAIKLKPELARRILFLTGDVVNDETLKFLQSSAIRIWGSHSTWRT